MARVPFLGQAVARDALRYRGYGYVYGGPGWPPGNWDCSSFVSCVLGRDLRLGLPGGRWGGPGMPPSDHGPVVEDYATWGGAGPVGIPRAGDLCLWVGEGPDGHIGIAISDSQMISALSPQYGTQVTAIIGTGPAGSPLVYRRLTGAGGSAALAAAIPARPAGLPVQALAVFALAAAGVVVAAGLVTAGLVYAVMKWQG